MFNNLVKPPFAFLRPASGPEYADALAPVDRDEESHALLAEQALDETAALPADLGQSGYDALPPHEHPSVAAGAQSSG